MLAITAIMRHRTALLNAHAMRLVVLNSMATARFLGLWCANGMA